MLLLSISGDTAREDRFSNSAARLPQLPRDSSLVGSLRCIGRGYTTKRRGTGLDFPVHSTRALLKNQGLEFWQWIWEHTGTADSGTGSYTAELHILADVRVLFTANPENIKAILTTQFQDFGKGKFSESRKMLIVLSPARD